MSARIRASAAVMLLAIAGSSPARADKDYGSTCFSASAAAVARLKACKLLRDHSHDPATLAKAAVVRGMIYYRAGKHELALDEFRQELKISPFPTGFIIAAKDAIAGDRLAVAMRYLTEGLKVAPQEAYLASSVAYILRKQGLKDEAIAQYNAVLGREPTNAFALYGRGITRGQYGETWSAAGDFALARQLDPAIDASFATFYGAKPSP